MTQSFAGGAGLRLGQGLDVGVGFGLDPGTDPGDHDGDVVVAAAQVGQVEEVAAGVRGVEVAAESAELGVFDRPGETVGAEQEDVSLLDRERPFDVDLDARVGAKAPGDDVPGDRLGRLLGREVVPADEFPGQAVVEGKLVDPPAADPVDPRVADVGDQRPFGHQQEGGAGGSHPLEVAVGGGLAVDDPADLLVGLGDRLGRGACLGLVVVVRDVVAGELAGKLADGVGPHPVGDHEEVAARLPGLDLRGADDRVAILVVRPTHAGVGRGSLDDDVVPVHIQAL